MNPLIKKAIFRALGFLSWASLSAWLFVLVEYTEENDSEAKRQLLLDVYASMSTKYNMSIEEFNNYSSMVYEAMSEPKPQWNYPASLDFVLQAITTIGYGYITPQTQIGQMLCIFVSLPGIPITMLALKSIGEVIAYYVNAFVTKFEKKILKRADPKQVETKSASILFMLMVVVIVINSLFVMPLTEWGLLEGIYFWFITLTTTGFGDYVPYESQRVKEITASNLSDFQNQTKTGNAGEVTAFIFSEISFTFYLIFCLCVVSSVLNAIMAALEKQKCCLRCRCIPRKTKAQDVCSEESNTQERRETNITILSMESFGFRTDNAAALEKIEEGYSK